LDVEITPQQPLAVAVKNAGLVELHRARQSLLIQSDGIDEAIHEFRKSTKRVRALLRLQRSCLGEDFWVCNLALRDAAGSLSTARDSMALLETTLALAKGNLTKSEQTSVAALLLHLSAANEEQRNQHVLAQKVQVALHHSEVALTRWEDGPLAEEHAIWADWTHGYQQAKMRYKKAQHGGAGRFHELRKSMKTQGYQLALLCPKHEHELRTQLNTIDSACELLGYEHDLYLIETHLPMLEIESDERHRLRRLLSMYRRTTQEAALKRCSGWLKAPPTERRDQLQRVLRQAKPPEN
jgi:CHAD domain-containing protein